MANRGDSLPADPEQKRSEALSTSGQIPLDTVRTAQALIKQFGQDLVARADTIRSSRPSKTLTDADLIAANHEMRQRSNTSRTRRSIGDLAMIFGGAAIGLYSAHFLVAELGVLLCAAGLYIREWDGN